MSKRPRVIDVDSWREEMLDNSRSMLIMVAGNPTVTDKDDSEHYVNSVMGRLDKLEDANVETAKVIGEMRRNTFSWDQTISPFIEKHVWKFLGLAALGLLYAHDRGWVKLP